MEQGGGGGWGGVGAMGREKIIADNEASEVCLMHKYL